MSINVHIIWNRNLALTKLLVKSNFSRILKTGKFFWFSVWFSTMMVFQLHSAFLDEMEDYIPINSRKSDTE
jgi:hypothetical protein